LSLGLLVLESVVLLLEVEGVLVELLFEFVLELLPEFICVLS